MSEADEKFRRIIEECGWHVMQVRNKSGESGPTFSYSTGLWKNYQHPEFIVFGQSEELEQLMINIGGDEVKSGTRKFEAGKYYDGFLGGFDVFMIEAGHIARKEYAVWADWYYERQEFPLLQIVWPTTNGIWPWDKQADEGFRALQPLLSKSFGN